jgi:citronellol/citronellal dehydrogenase
MTLAGRTIFITGGSRGIGLAIALRAARDGARIAIAAKTAEAHPSLPGTIHTAAAEIEAAGGRALPILCDIRNEQQVEDAVARAADHFGGIDVLVCNASAVSLTDTRSTSAKRFDLMHQINVRGSFLAARACIPHLTKSTNPHILSLSPPLDISPAWWGAHVAYTLSKFGMSALVHGWSVELAPFGIAANALWPRTLIDTAALRLVGGGEGARRSPELVADAAHAVLCRDSRTFTGNFLIDDEVLAEAGITDLDRYKVGSGPISADLFVDDNHAPHGVVARTPLIAQGDHAA